MKTNIFLFKSGLNRNKYLIFCLMINFYFMMVLFNKACSQTPTPEPQTPMATPNDTNAASPPLDATPIVGNSSGPVTLSQPSSVPTEEEKSISGPSEDQKPSQNEGDKAPIANRPTAVPEFSLPEVVITGENELTIGAQRLERKEDDVTLGSHDLTGVERGNNDLPGLDKTLTALSTQNSGPPEDTALVLHLGGGIPDTYGGWGLFGQEFTDFQYLLSGFYSTWGGEATAKSFDGDTRYGYGGEFNFFPERDFNFMLLGNFKRVEAELPYQDSQQEYHDGIDFSGIAHWKLSDFSQAQIKFSDQLTYLTYWNQDLQNNQTQELETNLKVTTEEIGPVLNRISIEAGERHATSDFSPTSFNGYDWGWLTFQGLLKGGENLSLSVQLQGQAGRGMDLPLQIYPQFNLMWRIFENSQLNLYWLSDRTIDPFQNDFMDTEHIAPAGGFMLPTIFNSDWGGKITQKITEDLLLSLSASTNQIQNYHQWTDLNASDPDNIQYFSTVGLVQLTKVGANLQWDFIKDWQVALNYQWTKGDNQSGIENLTSLPEDQWMFSLGRGDDQWETKIDLLVSSDYQGFQNAPGVLPAYSSIGLEGKYHFTRTFSIWVKGDNLLGQSIYLEPGYLEPQYHLRAGVEIIF